MTILELINVFRELGRFYILFASIEWNEISNYFQFILATEM
jgi:hypothetical protein